MRSHRTIPGFPQLVLIASIALCHIFTHAALAEPTHQTLSTTIRVSSPGVTQTARGAEVSIDGFGSLLVPGKPKLPSRIFAIGVPPGADVVDVSFEVTDGIALPGVYAISPAPLPRVIGDEDPVLYERDQREYDANYRATYGSDDAYPQAVAEFVRTARYREYSLADVRVTPVTYRPLSGLLTRFPEITVHVTYTVPERSQPIPVVESPRTARIAREIIHNYDQLKIDYPDDKRNGRAIGDFVIITLDSLVPSVNPLVDWITAKGRAVQVVTTAWINMAYTGYDLAEKIRNFLREKYPGAEWGIEDVLLVGHFDDVPMRRTAQDVGYGQPETDFYYAELSLPDSESWDADGDHQYGEGSDPIDFYSEVNVGRIPWSDPASVRNICEKSVAYEQNDDPSFKKNILLLGAYFWDNTDNAVLMEAKVDQPWMSDWTMTRMYEQNSGYYSPYPCDYALLRSNVQNIWSSGTYAFVNWAGHGSPTSSHILGLGAPAFISSSDCPLLNDDYPAIIFADACSNSDTDYVSIAQSMIKEGGVGFLGATKVAYGCPAWADPYDGSSQSLDYFFTTRVTSGDYSIGEAHQAALRDMYVYGLWDSLKYETFEWGAIFGDPDLRMGAPPILYMTFPDGLPEYLDPGLPTTFTVQIKDGLEAYVPGSGTLHYRYDGGAFLTSPLVHVTGDFYEATLPAAGVGDNPEYYLSIQGDAGSTVLSPPNAPDTVHTAIVGTFGMFFEDAFDTDPGWTTEGLWAYGQPTGGGGEYGGPDPTSGHTGSNVYGYNLSGDYENYLDERHLTSTPIDCTDRENVTLKFWRWLGVEQPLYDHAYVRVSNNGTTWTTVWQNTGEITDISWTLQEIDISAIADDEPTVYLRWTMGTTDVGWQYCGWNIDDIELWGLDRATNPCSDGVLGEGEERIDCGGPCPPCECTTDEVCPDGLFCNGQETCDEFGHCQAGAEPCPPSLCDEDADACDLCASNADCTDGVYCNGAEWCDGAGACQPDAPVTCDDGVDCTVDSCNEDVGSCDHIPDDTACDDENVCTTDWCDAGTGCMADGTGIVDPCDDGNPCTADDVCQGDAAGTCAGSVALPPREEEPTAIEKNRYLSFMPDNPDRPTAIAATLIALPGYEYAEGRTMWIQEPFEVTEAPGSSGASPPPTFWVAELGCTPFYTDWADYGLIDVYDDAIVPDATFELRALGALCDRSDPGSYSEPLQVSTSAMGDIVGDCEVTPCTGPQGVIDFIDITAVVDKFRNLPDAPRKAILDLINSNVTLPLPDRKIDFVDIGCCVDAFRDQAMPVPGPPVSDPCN